MRVLFMGSPEYAVQVLRALRTVVSDETLRVVSQPDKPQGRGRRVQPSPVSRYAGEANIALDRPERLRDFREVWEAFAPDVIVTAAYGRILPRWLLAMPLRAINLHASLLPRWRGANPIAWAIYAGDAETGVSVMEMAEGVDEGPVLAQRRVAIEQEDTLTSLTGRLGAIAGELLVEVWPAIVTLPASAQSADGVTFAPKFSPSMARLDWSRAASQEAQRIRSMTQSPGAYTMWDTRRIRLAPGRIQPGSMKPGSVRLEGDAWVVGCGQDTLKITKIQPEGKAWMTPGAFVRGLRSAPPEQFL